jgi:hypothetical protein
MLIASGRRVQHDLSFPHLVARLLAVDLRSVGRVAVSESLFRVFLRGMLFG